MHPVVESIKIDVAGWGRVSGLLNIPDKAAALLVMAHGAGAGMNHPFMSDLALSLADRRIGSLRFQFPFMENGSPRPNRPDLAKRTIRAAVAVAARQIPTVPLFAGGRSFGGRMTSQAQAEAPLPGVRGLIFVGFPLHPAGKPSDNRGEHLFSVKLPMLFLQGTKDALANSELVQNLVRNLGPRARLRSVKWADHSFHVPVKSGRNDRDILEELADSTASWMTSLTKGERSSAEAEVAK